MSLRDNLIPLVDSIRESVIDVMAGLRLHTVAVRQTAWDSGTVGRGVKVNYDHYLEPVPKVENPSPSMTFGQPGVFEDGDRVVSRISAMYDKADLFDAPADGTEQFWLIDGEEYKVVGEPQLGYLGWEVQVRRRRRKATGTAS